MNRTNEPADSIAGPPARLRVAVVGGGVAGLTAAWLLAPRHDVTLYEGSARLGGHTRTVEIPTGPDAGTPVDMGFIVYNVRNYPTFVRLLARLGVETQRSDMSFGFHRVRDGFQYAGTGPSGLFARRRGLVSPRFLGMLGDIVRFGVRARADLRSGRLAGLTIGEYVDRRRMGAAFRGNYLVPMASAIWSMRPSEIPGFPAEAFVRFFDNHGLLTHFGAPSWRTIRGGSSTYVRAMLADITRAGGEVRTGAKVRVVRRGPEGVLVEAADSTRHDRVVLATHADEALALLDEPSPDERRLLGAWRSTVNHAVLHHDASVLPPRRSAWAAWNYEEEPARSDLAPVCVTYWMNRLQRLRATETWCVTLNRRQPIDERAVVERVAWTHPVYDARALATQDELPRLNGARGTWYCGSYFGWGFHEDAVASAAAVGRDFGVNL